MRLQCSLARCSWQLVFTVFASSAVSVFLSLAIAIVLTLARLIDTRKSRAVKSYFEIINGKKARTQYN